MNVPPISHSEQNGKQKGYKQQIMRKLNIQNLVIEVTRRCNMACNHCMRGETENVDIDTQSIDTFLDSVKNIGSITLTGGEPTLSVDKLKYILNAIKTRNIEIMDFYLVTNGKEIPDEFMHVMLDYYLYATSCGSDCELSAVSLSKDKYHEKISYENKLKLKAFRFLDESDHATDFSDGPYGAHPIDLGRAADNVAYTRPHLPSRLVVDEMTSTAVFVSSDTNLTLTVSGDILSDCDYAYNAIDIIKIGHASDMQAFIKLCEDTYKKDYE